MRYPTILSILLIIISCNEPIKTVNKKQIEITEDKAIKVLFGSEELANGAFPIGGWEWQWDTDSVSEGDRLQKKFMDQSKYYRKSTQESSFVVPKISNVEYLRIGYPYEFKDYITDSLDIKQHITNIGPYECYYSFVDNSILEKPNSTYIPDTTTYQFNFEPMVVSEVGNLVFYDPRDKKAKVITVYFYAENSIESRERLFYIDSNKIIHVYNSIADETSRDFKNDYTIKVKDSGEIDVVQNK